jgi:hypothetical protein
VVGESWGSFEVLENAILAEQDMNQGGMNGIDFLTLLAKCLVELVKHALYITPISAGENPRLH